MEALRERFGKYHVLAKLAQGGMAEVYKVKTVGIAGFEKVQALKRILPHSARDARFIRSFIDEARIAVELSHRNIVQVFDFGKADGELFLAMELIEGKDLRTAIAQASTRGVGLPITVAAHIISEAAAGLDFAHRKTDGYGGALGIVHCDVSPSNIMLSADGYVKVLDFGVARATFAAALERRRLRGKPRYMAPEQTLGEPATAASDVFALGIIAWELVTGQPLFRGRDLRALLEAVRRTTAARVDELNPRVPREIADAIATALAREPGDRGSAADLAAACARTALGAGAPALAAWLAELDERASGTEIAPPPAHDRTSASLPPARPSTTLELRASTRSITGPAFGPPVRTSVLRLDEEATEMSAGFAGEPSAEIVLEADLAPDQAAAIAEEVIDDELGAAESGVLAERRRVVVIAAQLDGGAPGHARAVARSIAELAYQRGGVVLAQDRGELVLAFGLEIAGEDDVAIAMGWALDAAALVRDTAGDAEAEQVPRLRVGARTGVVAGAKPPDAGGLPTEAIDEARALAREASPDRPLFVGGAGRLTSTLYAVREVPTPRRIARRSRALEVLGPRGFDERGRARLERRGRFVGRAAQLAELEAAFSRARESGRRVTALVSGVAGSGKSRLVAELVARCAAGEGAPRVVIAAASPAHRHAPFALVVDLYQAALGLPPARGRIARGQVVHRLARVLQDARVAGARARTITDDLVLAMELRDGAALGGATEAADLRPRISDGLVAFRGAAARSGAALLTVIEDLHQADAASLEVLRHGLASEAPGAELLVLTARPDDAAPPATDATIELGDLVGADLRALIADRLGEAATPLAIAAVLARGGGNPLFVEELAQAVREAGDDVPASVRDVLAARVDRLSAPARTALRFAAVVGGRVRARVLEELVGADELSAAGSRDEAGEPASGVGELVEAGFLVTAGEDELQFARGLVREVVYDALPLRARREAHARLGRLLASRFFAGRDEPPAEIAEHLERGGLAGGAAAFWLRAGRLALEAGDTGTAIAQFGRTLALERELGDAPPSAASAARRRIAEAGVREAMAIQAR